MGCLRGILIVKLVKLNLNREDDMKILIKLFSVILMASLVVGCGGNSFDDEPNEPKISIIPPPPPPVIPYTLYISEDSLSVGDPDNVSKSLDNANFPKVVEFLDVAANSYVADHGVSVNDALQDYARVLNDGKLTTDSTQYAAEGDTASPGHLVYGLLKLLWSRGLEARKEVYSLGDFPDNSTVVEIALETRYIGWNQENGTLRSVYSNQNEQTARATDVTISGDNVTLTYSEISPAGKSVIKIEKTATDIQIAGILQRTSFYDPLNSGQYNTQVERNNISMYFTARVTNDGIALRYCSMEDGITYWAGVADTCEVDSLTFTSSTTLCLKTYDYTLKRQSLINGSLTGQTCTFVRWYYHPTDTSNLDHATYGLDGSAWHRGTTTSGANNTGISVDAPTIEAPVFWGSDEQEFRFSL